MSVGGNTSGCNTFSRLKKLGIVLAVPMVQYVLVIIAVPLFMDAENVKTQLAPHSERYGLTLQHNGEATSKAHPSPAIYYTNLSISNAEGKELVSIPNLKLGIGWGGVFSSTQQHRAALPYYSNDAKRAV